MLGCGTIGPLHAEAAAGLRGARLVAVADTRSGRARALAERFGVAAADGVDGLLGVPGVDLVCVCTPSGTHGELARRIAAAGRHVVVEKPFDVRRDAARAAAEAAGRAGVTLSVISQHRFDDGHLRLRSAIAAGDLGPLRLAEGRAWWYRTQAYYDADRWRGTWALDGGALCNQGVHLVDLLLWLAGPVERVFARAATAAHRMEAEDVAVVNLAFSGGALGTLTVTTAAWPGAAETLSVAGERASVTVEAGRIVSWQRDPGGSAGPGGSADPAESPDPTSGGGGPGGSAAPPSAALGSRHLAVTAHRAQLQDVVDAAAEGRPPSVTAEDGLAALAVVEAAYESVRRGCDVAPEGRP